MVLSKVFIVSRMGRAVRENGETMCGEFSRHLRYSSGRMGEADGHIHVRRIMDVVFPNL
jgi:hypothetical protein